MSAALLTQQTSHRVHLLVHFVQMFTPPPLSPPISPQTGNCVNVLFSGIVEMFVRSPLRCGIYTSIITLYACSCFFAPPHASLCEKQIVCNWTGSCDITCASSSAEALVCRQQPVGRYTCIYITCHLTLLLQSVLCSLHHAECSFTFSASCTFLVISTV